MSSIESNKGRYLQGEAVNINGTLWNDKVNKTNTCVPPRTNLTLQVKPINHNLTLEVDTSIHLNGCSFSHTFVNIWDVGKYEIISSIENKTLGRTTIEIIPIYWTPVLLVFR